MLAQSVVRVGGEFQVNQYTTNHQYRPAVASDADGDFVVTWTSAGQDGAGASGVFAARFDSNGAPLGDELQVNVFTSGLQRFPSMAASHDGDFVVVWQSYQQDGNLDGVFGRRFGSDGTPLAGEFQVNAYTSGFQIEPDVAADDDGDFVVVWRSTGQDGAGHGVFGRRYDSAGAALAAEFQINTITAGNQGNPAVALDNDGDFVVAWESNGHDGSGYAVFAQRFSSAGVAQGAAFLANTYTINNQARPAVALDADGDFVIAWQSLHQDGLLPNGDYGIFARRWTSAGVAQASEFQVNVYTLDYQRVAEIAADDSGDFVVTWESRLQDGSLNGVFARRFGAAADAIGGELQVNTYTTNSQTEPAIAFDSDGDFVITWRTYEPQDGHLSGVFAQRFAFAPLAILDIDGNGDVDPLTDGLLNLRHRFGFTGANLTNGAVGPSCTRCDAASIAAYINGLGLALDIDNNGALETLTDALLILRFEFGFTGANLTSNAVAMSCVTRCDATTILAYLQTLD